MKQDEIIEMARQAGLKVTSDNEILPSYFGSVSDGYFKFAKLVAAKEREACAKVCEDIFYAPEPEGCGGDEYYYTRPYLDCAEAIRARGEA